MKNIRYEFSMHNRYISNKLLEHGVVYNKTHKVEFPNISEGLINSFILGYYDGDGGITKYAGNYNNHTISFTGNDLIIHRIQEIINFKFNRKGSITIRRKTSPNIITLVYTGTRSIVEILLWLYKDCSIFNKIKHNKFLSLCSKIKDTDVRLLENKFKKYYAIEANLQIQETKNKIREEISQNILEDLLNGLSIRQIRIKHKRNSNYIRKIINENNINYGRRKRVFTGESTNI